jgi:hypothetical protein
VDSTTVSFLTTKKEEKEKKKRKKGLKIAEPHPWRDLTAQNTALSFERNPCSFKMTSQARGREKKEKKKRERKK